MKSNRFNRLRSIFSAKSTRKSREKANIAMVQAQELSEGLCSDSGVCLALGIETDRIKELFDGFTKFAYVTEENPIQPIGVSSSNGFIKKINYNNGEYLASAILKSSQKPASDNLMYEYLVGQYINKLNKLYSCFIETYGYYRYLDNESWETMKKDNDVSVLKEGLLLQTIKNFADPGNFDTACEWSKYLAILVQNFNEVKSLQDMLTTPGFIENDLLGILFQIYMPLAMVKDTFTHYDLHLKNIQIYEPIKGHYIEYHYYLPFNKVLSFKSKYIAKIIDYGRCYFNDEKSKVNSKAIFEEVCKPVTCGNIERSKMCGYNQGFKWLRDQDTGMYIVSQKKNISHDLLALARLSERFIQLSIKINLAYPAYTACTNIFAKLNYAKVDPDTAKKYGSFYFGTPEIEKVSDDGKINNVEDAYVNLLEIMEQDDMIQHNNDVYAASKKIGDLHIYSDGLTPMQFVQVQEQELEQVLE